MPTEPPLIVHIVHRFAIGGMENGLVNLINRLPADLARHHVIGLCGIDPEFVARVLAPTCTFENLDLPPGRQTAFALTDITKRLRRLAPAILHTRNIATLECQFAAWAAGVPMRLHGEHGWDESDRYGSRRRYTWLRRLARPLIAHQIALSGRTADYLRSTIGVTPTHLHEINNGVDTRRFTPRDPSSPCRPPNGWPFASDDFVLMTAGRLSPIKNQTLLVKAFLRLRDQSARFAQRARLVIVGDGIERRALEDLVIRANARQSVWFAGNRRDMDSLLRQADVFALTSHAEGLSNAILEAMACGLAVIATDVGGNAQMIEHGNSGTLVPDNDAPAFIGALQRYFEQPCHRVTHGCTARTRVVERFGIHRMVADYQSLYVQCLDESRFTLRTGKQPVLQADL